MKLFLTIVGCAATVAVAGCAVADRKSHNRLSGEHIIPMLETISYHWEGVGIDVSFTKGQGDLEWGVTVRDSWDIYDQFKEPAKEWGLSASKCSEQDCLRLIDQSLTRFQTGKPAARFKYVAVEMHVVSNLWSEILTGMSQKLLVMDGKMPSPIVTAKGREMPDVPEEITSEVLRAIKKSITIAEIRSVLKKHGVNSKAIDVANPIIFKDSLAGRKWSDIATLPGVGIQLPGVVEFDFSETRLDAGSEIPSKEVAVSRP